MAKAICQYTLDLGLLSSGGRIEVVMVVEGREWSLDWLQPISRVPLAAMAVENMECVDGPRPERMVATAAVHNESIDQKARSPCGRT